MAERSSCGGGKAAPGLIGRGATLALTGRGAAPALVGCGAALSLAAVLPVLSGCL